MSENVTRWADEARIARERAGLSADELPLSVILAIVHVESGGNPKARRPDSQYYGLTQVGALAAIDGGLIKANEYNQLRADLRAAKGQEARDAARAALSTWRKRAAQSAFDPDRALLTFCQCVARYKSRTHYQGISILEGVAVMWKGGAGTASKVRADIRGGAPLEDALHAREVDADNPIPRLREYVERAREAHPLYTALDRASCS